jgi:hypothetical protein
MSFPPEDGLERLERTRNRHFDVHVTDMMHVLPQMLLQAEACDLTARTKMSLTPLDLAQQDYRRRSQPEMSRVLTQEMERRRSHGTISQC